MSGIYNLTKTLHGTAICMPIRPGVVFQRGGMAVRHGPRQLASGSFGTGTPGQLVRSPRLSRHVETLSPLRLGSPIRSITARGHISRQVHATSSVVEWEYVAFRCAVQDYMFYTIWSNVSYKEVFECNLVTSHACIPTKA